MRDIDVRHALLSQEIAQICANDSSTCVVQELGILQGAYRIDIAVINGRLLGYEIKSKSDTLERLPAQQENYSRVFDEITLVVDEHHAVGAHKIIPEWWRIIVVSGDRVPVFTEWRLSRQNPSIEPFALCQLLWKEEAIGLLAAQGITKGFNSKPRNVVWRTLSESMDLESLRQAVRECLKSRQSWRVQTA